MDISLTCFLAIFACISICEVFALCPYKCNCRSEPSSCPTGVNLMRDGCNCCNQCGRREGESCDTQTLCDSNKSLICDFANGDTRQGICKVQLGRSCSYGGKNYLNGEMFQPTCKHQCWCMDGTVGCMSLCSHETRVPHAEDCPNARLHRAEGQCCERWLCDSGDEVRELPLDLFWDKYVDERSDSEVTLATLPGQDAVPPSSRDNSLSSSDEKPYWDTSDLNRHSYYKSLLPGPLMEDNKYDTVGDGGSDGDELIDYQMAQVLLQKGGKGLKDWFGDEVFDDEEIYEYDNWAMTNDVIGDEDADRGPPISNCAVQTTSWSSCSKTCGMGIATRVTNNNYECQLTRESRLCNVRPCGNADYVRPKRGKHCLRHKREHRRTYFTYAGCRSVRAYRPRFCGGCDDGRCCTPQSTRTVKVRFRCESGDPFIVKKMLMIRSCRCHHSCSSNTANTVQVSRDLSHDMFNPSEA